jgi:hypothetical protein
VSGRSHHANNGTDLVAYIYRTLIQMWKGLASGSFVRDSKKAQKRGERFYWVPPQRQWGGQAVQPSSGPHEGPGLDDTANKVEEDEGIDSDEEYGNVNHNARPKPKPIVQQTVKDDVPTHRRNPMDLDDDDSDAESV